MESPDPRTDGETTIVPTWSLDILPDASVSPTLPTELRFRDGVLIRPVCPFFELWAMVGAPGSAANTWRAVPLTPTLLGQQNASVSNLTLRIDAHNLKAARRTGNPRHGFGTRPAVAIGGDDHGSHVLFATSPGPNPRMIPSGRSIPLGSVQIMRSKPNQPSAPWNGIVDLEVIRWRFTPGRGRFFGPPQAAQTKPPAVEAANAFLNANAGWFGAAMSAVVAPPDTYDGAEATGRRSLGVVDDTCEARMEVSLALPGSPTPLVAFANVFSGPPDFGPDRRPFLSVADELNDREADANARSAAMTPAERDAWVEDLFERVYETVSLLNVDYYRSDRGLTLTGNRLGPPLANDHVTPATQAMGGRDALRNPRYTVQAVSNTTEPLPLSKHARRQHRAIADAQNLRDFIALNPGRIEALVRAPFEIERGETPNESTMRMPPFMRQSNAQPLTLSTWQYELLMQWVATANAAAPPPAAPVGPAPPPPNVVAAASRAPQGGARAARRRIVDRMSMLAQCAADAGAPLFKRISSRAGEHVLVVPHSRIYDLPSDIAGAVRCRRSGRDPSRRGACTDGGWRGAARPRAGARAAKHIAECELGLQSGLHLLLCGPRRVWRHASPTTMTDATARAAVDRLFATADATRPVTVGFLGGEPFVNRELVHGIVAYASRAGRARRLDVRFSVTTNATLLRPDDLALLRDHPFAVTVSLDGGAAVQNAQRPTRGGRPSFDAVSAGIEALLANPGSTKIAARATVTRDNLNLESAFASIRASRISRGWFCTAALLAIRQCAHIGGLAALSRRAAADRAFRDPRCRVWAWDRVEQSCDCAQAIAPRRERALSVRRGRRLLLGLGGRALVCLPPRDRSGRLRARRQ